MKKHLTTFIALSFLTAPLAHAEFDRTYKAKYANLKERMCGPSQSGVNLIFHDCDGKAIKYMLGFPNAALAADCTNFAKSVSQNAMVGGKKCSTLKIVAPGAGPTEFIGAKCTCTP